jgi:magnesium-transporting ATPase (P-type)
MTTGDHPRIAEVIARQASRPPDELTARPGLEESDAAEVRRRLPTTVFAPAVPEPKPQSVEGLKAGGAVVARTGAVVNDARRSRRRRSAS